MCVILHMSVITQDGYSALMAAAGLGKTETVVELVKAGANVDMQNEVCQYIYVVHDVNVQNHTSRLNTQILVTHTYIVHVCIPANHRTKFFWSKSNIISLVLLQKNWFLKKQKDDITKLQSEATFCS